MKQIIPKVTIEGREVDFIRVNYAQPGILSAATLQFTIPLTVAGTESLWNKEVTFYVSKSDSKPIFRGWINRTKKDFNKVNIFAEDAFGYMLKGGDTTLAEVVLDDRENVDGLTGGAAIIKLLQMSELTEKVGTDFIGDTSPVVGSVQKEPIRGTLKVLDVIKQLLAKPINLSDQDLPRPNIAKLIDDGSKSQLVIELESTLTNDQVKYVYTPQNNITTLNIIDRKVPTVVIVEGAGGVKGTFKHNGAIAALDRTFLKVTNNNLDSPAACKEFAARLYQANVANRYQYNLGATEGFYLMENDVIRVETDDKDFSGNYRIVGKSIIFGNGLQLTLTINKKPPTLAEYISSRDN